MTHSPPQTPEQWLEEVARRSNLPPNAAALMLKPQRRQVEDMRAAGLNDAEMVAELGQPIEAVQELQNGWQELKGLRKRLRWPHWSMTLVALTFTFYLWAVWAIDGNALPLLGYFLTCSGMVLAGLYLTQRRVSQMKYLWQKLAQQREMSHTLALACLFASQMWVYDISSSLRILGVAFLALFLLDIFRFHSPYLERWQACDIDIDHLLFVNLEEDTP